MFLRTRRRDPAHGRLDDAAVCMATGLCKTVCKGCVPKLESFLSCTAGHAGWSPDQSLILSILEAFADRDFGSGEAVDKQGRWHPNVWSRQTCRILTDMDRAAVKLRDECSELATDEQMFQGVAKAFSEAKLSAKPSGSNCVAEDPECAEDVADGGEKPEGCWGQRFRAIRRFQMSIRTLLHIYPNLRIRGQPD